MTIAFIVIQLVAMVFIISFIVRAECRGEGVFRHEDEL